MTSSLSDQLVVVAGGGSGIGLATVELLRHEGARPVVLDRRLDDLPEGVSAHAVDLTDYAATVAAVSHIVDQFGVPDAVVNCVGLAVSGRFLETAPDTWARSLDVNLMTCVYLAHTCLPAMAERGSGRLVLVSSAAAQMGLTDDALYAASKAAVEGLTRALALEFARSGVAVNCVAPGPILTPLFLQQAAHTRQAIARRVPVRRVGQPDEIARVIAFLAAPDVPFLTGQVVGVNGGLHVGH